MPFYFRETDHYDGRRLMVWAGIMLNGYTPYHIFQRGTMISVMHRDEVWEPYVCLFRAAVGPEFLSMDDNARQHTALLVHEFTEEVNIQQIN